MDQSARTIIPKAPVNILFDISNKALAATNNIHSIVDSHPVFTNVVQSEVTKLDLDVPTSTAVVIRSMLTFDALWEHKLKLIKLGAALAESGKLGVHPSFFYATANVPLKISVKKGNQLCFYYETLRLLNLVKNGLEKVN